MASSCVCGHFKVHKINSHGSVNIPLSMNDRLCRKSCESYCLENNRSKKSLLAMCIGLTIENDVFDIEKIEVCIKCKDKRRLHQQKHATLCLTA